MSHCLKRGDGRSQIQIHVAVQEGANRCRAAGDENNLDAQAIFFEQSGSLRDVGDDRRVAGDRCVRNAKLLGIKSCRCN